MALPVAVSKTVFSVEGAAAVATGCRGMGIAFGRPVACGREAATVAATLARPSRRTVSMEERGGPSASKRCARLALACA
ncbi:MAG: hypothetical protein GY772_23990, partial [bacterium]|nr:hypothetical protein [bacterium]